MCSLSVYEMELMVSEVGYSAFSSPRQMKMARCVRGACRRCASVFVSEHICAHCLRACVCVWKLIKAGAMMNSFCRILSKVKS